MTLSMEEKVQTAAETVINASAADETVTGGTTPPEPLSEKRIVHAEDFDPLFAMSEEDCVEGFIKREMQRAGITEEQNLIPEDMLRRKNILNAVLEEHKEVNAGIIFNSRAHLLGKYFRDKGERFRLIGYDVIDPNITCLNDGSITHLIAQRPEVQGFNCIRALFRHLVLKEKVEQINYMPTDILMKANIKYYNNYI